MMFDVKDVKDMGSALKEIANSCRPNMMEPLIKIQALNQELSSE